MQGENKESTMLIRAAEEVWRAEAQRLRKIEAAARAAYEHFAYLSSVGSSSRVVDPLIEALGEALGEQ